MIYTISIIGTNYMHRIERIYEGDYSRPGNAIFGAMRKWEGDIYDERNKTRIKIGDRQSNYGGLIPEYRYTRPRVDELDEIEVKVSKSENRKAAKKIHRI